MRRWLRSRLARPFLRRGDAYQEAARNGLRLYPQGTLGYSIAELQMAVGDLYQTVGRAIAEPKT